MKYQLLFATYLLQTVTNSQITPPATSYNEMSKKIEDKVKADMMMKIMEYDYNGGIESGLKEENININAGFELT